MTKHTSQIIADMLSSGHFRLRLDDEGKLILQTRSPTRLSMPRSRRGFIDTLGDWRDASMGDLTGGALVKLPVLPPSNHLSRKS